MRSTPFVVALVISAGMGLASIGAAQTATAPAIQSATHPTIHNVTLHAGTGMLTITGIGFGRELLVTVDGQPVTVVQGGTDTQIDVLAPASILTTPGTYRLTMVDPVRKMGDSFVVASVLPSIASVGAATIGTPAAAPAGPPSHAPAATTAQRQAGAASPAHFEDFYYPYNTAFGTVALGSVFPATGAQNTAIGWGALTLDTAGNNNTGSGFEALYSNTSGSNNTATGFQALFSNQTGDYNTASGYQALLNNGSGLNNAASGAFALYANTTGSYNVAHGAHALLANTTGVENSAVGTAALFANTTGNQNAASGAFALYSNTTGFHNTAGGAYALYANTTGSYNVASGTQALAANTGGSFNTADGVEALSNNTTGSRNTAIGLFALLSNTTGGQNTAVGFNAGANATTGSSNLFLGADVTGTANDANTIRIGLPYTGGIGQNRTFIAGIHGTPVTDWRPVVIDANGQLGTINPQTGGGLPSPLSAPAPDRTLQDALDRLTTVTETVRAQQQQLASQQATNADLRARLARLEALMASANRR